jgi:hypothetical protein
LHRGLGGGRDAELHDALAAVEDRIERFEPVRGADLEPLERRAAAPLVERLLSKAADNTAGLLLLNPCAFARRITLERDDRTVRRRIDEGIEQVAALAVAVGEPEAEPGPRYPSRSWHTEELRVTLALDQPVAEAFEFRRVIVDADEIAELDLALTLRTSESGESVRESDLDVDVFHGGVLSSRGMESSERIGWSLRLPEPLRRGDRHEVGMRFRANMREPHYICVPRHPCDLFDLHVRFGDRVPDRIVRLEKAFQNDTRSPRGAVLETDDAGEVHVRFRHLAPGFAYGIRWQPAGAQGQTTRSRA